MPILSQGGDLQLTAYTDSDFAGSTVDRKSTSGGAQFLGPCMVSWSSRKQNVIALSTAEAEYIAGAACCAQVLWLRQQLSDYGVHIAHTPIYCDSTSAIFISKDHVMFSRTKHMDTRFHFLRDNVEKGNVSLVYCPTGNQIADIFTKALPRVSFEKQRLGMGMISLS